MHAVRACVEVKAAALPVGMAAAQPRDGVCAAVVLCPSGDAGAASSVAAHSCGTARGSARAPVAARRPELANVERQLQCADMETVDLEATCAQPQPRPEPPHQQDGVRREFSGMELPVSAEALQRL